MKDRPDGVRDRLEDAVTDGADSFSTDADDTVILEEEAERPSLIPTLFLAVMLTFAFAAANWAAYLAVGVISGGAYSDGALSRVISRGIVLLICAVILRRREGVTKSLSPAGGIGWAVLLGCALQVAFAYVLSPGAFTGTSAIGARFDPLSLSAWASLLVSAFLSPFTEELLFRGVIFARLRSASGRSWIWAGVISSLLFALVHSTPQMALTAFAAGMCFAFLTECQGSVIPAVWAHVSFNLLSFFTGYLPVLGWVLFAVALSGAAVSVAALVRIYYSNKSNEKDRYQL